ncbi:hypothetical protein VTK73DRAFT_6792 [Phialemonium thermophilum]|uniref:Conserved oligomeric Golgi complex subunit 3 n=1 Tax=Phialemonium thermophilum TaxID=223376 RepID=A0ABR3Y743_9PEZI
MYEDSWYSFVPEVPQHKRNLSQGAGHRRRDSLLQQENGTTQVPNGLDPLRSLYEEEPYSDSPPEPTTSRRSKSCSSFVDIAGGRREADGASRHKKRKGRRKAFTWEALDLPSPGTTPLEEDHSLLRDVDDELLKASQAEYLLYHEQLTVTERHLDTLIDDTNRALKVLASLCDSFRSVEDQTTAFRSQCEDLLSDQKRLQTLVDEVGSDLHYYTYLDNVSRRLNAPGASRLVDDDVFSEILSNLDSCIHFMVQNPTYRDAESYLARYQALMGKALHLLEVGFTARLEKASRDISAKLAASQSESAKHALAYGRFEELMEESYSLIPNVQKVILSAYDEFGNAKRDDNFGIYVNTAKNLFDVFLSTRDRDLKPLIQQELDELRAEVKDASVETASRNFIKQYFERSYSEAGLFSKLFGISIRYSPDEASVYGVLKSHHRSPSNPVNIVPLATSLQGVLQHCGLETVCSVVGWATNEYGLVEYDEEETEFSRHCRELTARLLTDHLWPFTDSAFEAEIAQSISKHVIRPETLTIGPVTDGVASSNAYPPVKRALELLVLFDQSMPKDRCQRNSPVVFKIVMESIAVLRRVEARMKSAKSNTDADLFMIKNLLILKNELLSLEIGDVRSQAPEMQHFGQIWDALSPQGLMDLLSTFSSYIPGSSFWSQSARRASPANGRANGRGAAELDAGEQLDNLLRQAIYSFTRRWAQQINDAQARKSGARSLAEVEAELDEMIERAFSNQTEVIAKLKEAIQLNAEALRKPKQAEKGIQSRENESV